MFDRLSDSGRSPRMGTWGLVFRKDNRVCALKLATLYPAYCKNCNAQKDSSKLHPLRPVLNSQGRKTVCVNAYGQGSKLDRPESCAWKTRGLLAQVPDKGDLARWSEGAIGSNCPMVAGIVSPASEYLASNGSLGRL